MPNTKEEWGRRVEKAVETLGEAAAMGMMPAPQIAEMIQAKAREFEGAVPKFGDKAPPPGGPPPGGPPGMPPGGPGGMPPGGPPGGMQGGPMPHDPEIAMERMPREDFGRLREDVARGRMGGTQRPPEPPPRR